MTKLNFSYSQLSAGSVAALVNKHYRLPAITNCKYYVLGLHDNYLLEVKSKKYILRIYRNDWRNSSEINFELELLDFLSRKNSQASCPICTTSGNLLFSLACPEGERFATLFPYADGAAPGNQLSTAQSEKLGTATAELHLASRDFTTKHYRPTLELAHLLDESVVVISPFLDSKSLRYLKNLQQTIHQDIPSIPMSAKTYGICAGDINPSNFHINSRGDITLFDFDQCGYGFWAFDIAKFFSAIHQLSNKKQALADSFLAGYESVRKLEQGERQSMHYLEMVAVIWVMAIHANNATRIGYKYLEKPFWDKRLDVLKELHGFMAGYMAALCLARGIAM